MKNYFYVLQTTKKIVGDIEKSAVWATNVSNEFGQLLTIVFIVKESAGVKASGDW